jgi:hypothetical protein
VSSPLLYATIARHISYERCDNYLDTAVDI